MVQNMSPTDHEEAAQYMTEHLTPLVSEALAALARARPAEPVLFLANYLQEHKPAARSVEVVEEEKEEPPVEEPPPRPSTFRRRGSTTGMVVPHLLDPLTGNAYEVEEGEELKTCLRCSKSFVTFSGKSLCVSCRDEFAHVELEEGEEMRGCERCGKVFMTTSGKKLCVGCRHLLNHDEAVDEDEGEEMRGCAKCRKAFVTTSGRTLCMTCRVGTEEE